MVLVATKTQRLEDNSLSHKEVYTLEDGRAKVLAYNAGVLCPPYCTNPGQSGEKTLGVTIIDKGDKGLTIV